MNSSWGSTTSDSNLGAFKRPSLLLDQSAAEALAAAFSIVQVRTASQGRAPATALRALQPMANVADSRN